MRGKATELGYGPSVPTPRDLDGARVLVEELGGHESALAAARRLSTRWAVFQRMFGALKNYPRPNLGAIHAVSPILGWLGEEEPRSYDRKAQREEDAKAKRALLSEWEYDEEVAAACPKFGWG